MNKSSKSTVFYKKNGGISSVRTTIGNGNNKIEISRYLGGNRGGITIRNNGVSARFNNKGQSMGGSIKRNKNTNYYDENRNKISKLRGF